MESTAPILEKQIGTRFAAPARGGYANAADFRAALANANGAAGPAEGDTVGSDRSKHIVKGGETLYGIASARLAAAGQPATPGASMRYALQIARANQIRDPDRIHIGQQLDLAGPAATMNGRNDAPTAGVRSATLSDETGVRSVRAMDWQLRIQEAYQQEDAGENDCDAAYRAPLPPMLPAAERVAADDNIRGYPDAAARVDVAHYQQTSPVEAPKPPGELPDIVYKGMIGKALDLVPLEPSTRTGLQQVNAVISNSFAGRSLAALTGLGGPLLTIAGLVWGLFSAQKISAMQSGAPKQVAQNATVETAR